MPLYASYMLAMTKARLTTKSQSDLCNLLSRSSRVLGLPVCFHDRTGRTRLTDRFAIHMHPACVEAKNRDLAACVQFDGAEVHKALTGNPQGRVHTCVCGYTQIAVPVVYEGMHGGVLFAGPCWQGKKRPPRQDLVIAPSLGWLEDRLALLMAVATQVATFLKGEASYVPLSRRDKVLEMIQDAMERPLLLREVAEEMGLSISRTGRVIREEFGVTFPGLVQRIRMREAAWLVSSTDLPINEVARRTGYEDPNYFSRVFARTYSMPPREYRRKYPGDA